MSKVLLPVEIATLPDWVKDLFTAGLEDVWRCVSQTDYWIKFLPGSDDRPRLSLGGQYSISIKGEFYVLTNCFSNEFTLAKAEDVVRAITLDDERRRLSLLIKNVEDFAFALGIPLETASEKLLNKIDEANQRLENLQIRVEYRKSSR